MSYALAQGLLGAVMGGAGSAVHSMDVADKERREKEMERLKEEMAQKRLKFLDDLKQQNEAGDRKRASDFYNNNKLPPEQIPGEEVDEKGKKIGDIVAESEPSRRAQAEHYERMAPGTGDKGIIDSARSEGRAVRADEEIARRTTADEKKAEAAERRAENDAERLRLQALRDAAKDENEKKRLDVLIAKLSRGEGGGGSDKEPAKIREVKALAELAFGGDIEKATSFAYGTNAKPRAEAVMSMFAALKNTDADTGKSQDLMKKAEAMVDQLRAKDSASRGGVKVGEKKEPAAEPAKDAPKGVAKPQTRAEYDALPSGALYVAKNGKTYRKP